jgi:hypothetical protein
LRNNNLPAQDITTTKFKEHTVQPAERWAVLGTAQIRDDRLHVKAT